nr:transferrin-binding protein-like solute binding protein [Marinicella sp. W31]MDC2879691.1 transferrin-binding protein-like solute binding protein [Marinicella sp. W31]
MNNKTIILTGVAVLLGLSGCSGGGGGGPLAPNALGYYGDVDTRNAVVTGSGSAAANIQMNGDGTVGVEITDGPDAGETALFYPDGAGYSANLGDGAEAYMRLGYFAVDGIKDGPVVALIDADTWDGNEVAMAFRSTDGMTALADMPLSGSARYSGQNLGAAALPGEYLDYVNGAFNANVNFGSGQLAGAMGTQVGDLTFDATISGSEFTSNANSIAVGNDYLNVDQANSSVNGAFYGDRAAGIAGTYKVNGARANRGAGMIGTFVGERN